MFPWPWICPEFTSATLHLVFPVCKMGTVVLTSSGHILPTMTTSLRSCVLQTRRLGGRALGSLAPDTREDTWGCVSAPTARGSHSRTLDLRPHRRRWKRPHPSPASGGIRVDHRQSDVRTHEQGLQALIPPLPSPQRAHQPGQVQGTSLSSPT